MMLSKSSTQIILRIIAKNQNCYFGTIAAEKISTTSPEQGQEDHLAKHHDQNMDSFTKEFLKNRIEMTTFQKILLSTGSSIAALIDPRR